MLPRKSKDCRWIVIWMRDTTLTLLAYFHFRKLQIFISFRFANYSKPYLSQTFEIFLQLWRFVILYVLLYTTDAVGIVDRLEQKENSNVTENILS